MTALRFGGLLGLCFFAVCPATLIAQTEPAEPPLPKYKDLPPPTADEILRGNPVDWIVLLNGDVIFCEPVQPRPKTLESLKAQYDAVNKQAVSAQDLPDKLKRLEELQRIKITLLDDSEDPEYTLELRFIERIVYFEDLIVRRISRLLDDRQMPTAYELLMYLDRRARGWEGFNEVYERFLFLEASRLLGERKLEAALQQAELLFDVDRTYPELSVLHGRITDALVQRAVEADDRRQGRFFLFRLQSREPTHPVVERWTAEFQQRTDDLIAQARAAQAAGRPREATQLVDRAARVWPSLSRLKDAHRELSDPHQILHVGVLRLPAETPSRIAPSPADDRQRQLTEIPLFEPDSLNSGVVRFRSAFVESWEPGNLGRDVAFRLKPRRATWESRPVLTSGAIVEALARRSDPLDPGFDERWADDVLSVEAGSPWEWRLRLDRIPLKIESRLRRPIVLSAAEREWSPDLAAAAAALPRQQRFYVTERTNHTVAWQRTRPQPPGPGPRLLAEIIEHKFDTWELLLQAIQRGDIDATPRVEWKDLAALLPDSRFFVHQTALPRTHILLVSPQSVLASNGTLRRALLHALPREAILHANVLQVPPQTGLDALPPAGRVATGPFASTTYGHHPQLQPPEYNPVLAASLAATARQQFDGKLPTLTLLVPDDPVVARAIPPVCAAWKLVGIDVTPVVATGNDTVRYDLVYRTVQATEPIRDLWPLLSPTGQTDLASIAFLPHWLRDQLLELDRAVDFQSAKRLLHRIETEFLIEARWLPLWEVDEWMLLRKRVSGHRERPMHPYQDVERWLSQSWYPTDSF
jgi:hypothetical protein